MGRVLWTRHEDRMSACSVAGGFPWPRAGRLDYRVRITRGCCEREEECEYREYNGSYPRIQESWRIGAARSTECKFSTAGRRNVPSSSLTVPGLGDPISLLIRLNDHLERPGKPIMQIHSVENAS